jgi:outer membrane protein
VKISVLASSLLLAASLASAQTPTKVGIIHIQNAILGTKDGQKALADLETRTAPKKKELESRQAQIVAKQEQLNKASNVGGEEAKQKLIRDIDQMKKAFSRDVDDAQADLDQENGKLMNEIGGKMMGILDKYAKDNGFALILDVSNQQTSPVLFAANGIDVTGDIVQLYDKQNVGGGAPSTSASPAAPKPGGAVSRPATSTPPVVKPPVTTPPPTSKPAPK